MFKEKGSDTIIRSFYKEGEWTTRRADVLELCLTLSLIGSLSVLSTNGSFLITSNQCLDVVQQARKSDENETTWFVLDSGYWAIENIPDLPGNTMYIRKY